MHRPVSKAWWGSIRPCPVPSNNDANGRELEVGQLVRLLDYSSNPHHFRRLGHERLAAVNLVAMVSELTYDDGDDHITVHMTDHREVAGFINFYWPAEWCETVDAHPPGLRELVSRYRKGL